MYQTNNSIHRGPNPCFTEVNLLLEQIACSNGILKVKAHQTFIVVFLFFLHIIATYLHSHKYIVWSIPVGSSTAGAGVKVGIRTWGV